MRLPSWLKSATGFSAAVGGPTRQDTYAVYVILGDPADPKKQTNLGIWDKLTGGGVSASATSYNPGGMQPPVSLGGRRSTANVVVSRLYRLARDHDHIQRLIDGVGKMKITVTKQPLDLEGNVYGKPIVYHGVLDRVSPPEVDSESSTAGLLEIEIVPEGFPVLAAP